MLKMLRSFLIALAFVAVAVSARAQTVTLDETATSGTVTATITSWPNSTLNRVDIDWTSDASGNVVCALPLLIGDVARIVFNPDAGDDQPDDNYDVTWTDADGLDLMAALGGNRDETNSEQILPTFTDGTTAHSLMIAGTSTLTILAAGNELGGVIRIYLRR